MEIPSSFRETILNTFGDVGRAWLEQLPSLIETLLGNWSAEIDGSLPELSYSFVAPVRRKNGERAVLKLGPHHRDRAREANALEFFNGEGAVRLLEKDLERGALLLERVEPGELLRNSGHDDAAATMCAIDVMDQLLRYTSEPKPQVLSHISVWGLTFEKYTREFSEYVIPLAHVERADRIYKHLVRSSPRETVLHGDLHHNNILRAGDTWVAIDPKGVWGDPCFEVGAFMRNPYPQAAEWPALSETLFRRMQMFSDELGFDLERVWGWSYAQSVMAAIWSVRDREDWRAWLKIAEALGALEEQL